jgi:hypothetical protein
VGGNRFRRTIKLAALYAQIAETKPALLRFGFEIVNMRAERLLTALESFPELVVEIFGPRNSKGRFNAAIVSLMRSSLEVGVGAREKMEPSDKPWVFDPDVKIFHEGINVTLVMKIMVQENPQLAFFPRQLEQRARECVIDYQLLQSSLRKAFRKKDLEDGLVVAGLDGSVYFVKLWQRINGDVGIADRAPIVTNDGNGGRNGGNGSQGGAAGNGNIAGYVPSNESGAAQNGMERGMLQYNGARITAPQTGVPLMAGARLSTQNPAFAAQSSLLMFRNLMPMQTVYAGVRF